jgi:hypothetical protein
MSTSEPIVYPQFTRFYGMKEAVAFKRRHSVVRLSIKTSGNLRLAEQTVEVDPAEPCEPQVAIIGDRNLPRRSVSDCPHPAIDPSFGRKGYQQNALGAVIEVDLHAG